MPRSNCKCLTFYWQVGGGPLTERHSCFFFVIADLKTRMPFSASPTSHLLIESHLQFDLGMTLTSFLILTSDKSNQVKLMLR